MNVSVFVRILAAGASLAASILIGLRVELLDLTAKPSAEMAPIAALVLFAASLAFTLMAIYEAKRHVRRQRRLTSANWSTEVDLTFCPPRGGAPRQQLLTGPHHVHSRAMKRLN